MLNLNTITTTSAKGRRRSVALSAAIVGTLALAVSSAAFADAELDALKKQVQDLQQKIDAMAKQQATTPAPTAPGSAATPPVIATAKTPSSDAVSMYGITLSGILDVGMTYQTYGTPLNDYFLAGLYSYIQKNSNRSIFTASESNLSQSQLQLTGEKEIMNGWSGIFRLQTGINPLSGNISDALKSVTMNNGVPCTKSATTGAVDCPQGTGADSSLAGELFNMAAFVGFQNKEYGTITVGRQNGLLADAVAKYDPMYTSNAFSVIGISGTVAGGGNTENRRLDNSLKYNAQFGAFHVGGQYQFNGATGQPGSAYQFVLGGTFAQGSIDAIYAKKYDAISVGALSAAQVSKLNCPYSYTLPSATLSPQCTGVAGVATAGGGFNAVDKSLSGTISDNEAFSLQGMYAFDKLKVYAGYEHITYNNPSDPLKAGTYTIGGYVLAYVNTQTGATATFAKEKTLQAGWLGMRYDITPSLNWSLAWYHLDQNSYATGANAGCKDTRAGNCSGTLDAVSTVFIYKLSKRFDSYGGLMWSQAKDGLASGFIETSTVNPTIGVRYTF